MSDLSEAWAEGREALRAGDWEAASAAFAAVLEVEEAPEALAGYGLATWFLGGIDEGMELRQRAVAEYGRLGECSEAARIAIWVSHQYLISGRASLANGWLERAERALEDAGECAGEGWVAVERARRSRSVEERVAAAERALELARRFDDADLEIFALSLLGRFQINAGAFEPGMRRLEEAMAAATAGRVASPHTLGEAYCNLLVACTDAGDWERATEWCELVDEYADRRRMTPLFGACRTIHADVLLAVGRWDDAEVALQDGLASHARHYPTMAAPTVATLALLRVRQGRLAEAEELLAAREERAAALLALAELRLAEGEPYLAVALLERATAASEGDVLGTARLLGPLVGARLAAGELGDARRAAAELRELATATGRPLVEAWAHLADARVALAEAPTTDALEPARAALEAFGRLGMPYEAAEARVVLARVLADRVPALAREEARSAFETFKGLGATRGMDAAGAVLRDLGVGSPPGPRGYGELTAREREVLELVAQGMTNARIAQTLFISERTAGHHVSRILSKLGAKNRAEAATFAARVD